MATSRCTGTRALETLQRLMTGFAMPFENVKTLHDVWESTCSRPHRLADIRRATRQSRERADIHIPRDRH